MNKFKKFSDFLTDYYVVPTVATLLMMIIAMTSDIFFGVKLECVLYSAGVFSIITAVWLSTIIVLSIIKRVFNRYFIHSAKITSKFNIVDILTNPSEYIDEYSDTEILNVPHEMAEGNILRFLVGIEDGNYYIVVEDDYGSEDIYQEENETLMQTFIRALNDNLVRE